jgi:probable RNA-binding protein EIF1AD
MSGACRKSQYRKGVTQEYISGNPVPDPNKGEVVARVVGNRGAGIFEIALPTGETDLCSLPRRFKNVIFVKKNDFLIVERGSAPPQQQLESDTFRYACKSVLSRDHIKHIKALPGDLWPSCFDTPSILPSGSGSARRTTQQEDHFDPMPGYVVPDGLEEHDESDPGNDEACEQVEVVAIDTVTPP